ncbi:hypothetical protein K8352_19525 [Flavobacteriaceae bacterium F89]|uniref:Outer membrane protein beta-barrel domain-containing protein n=1 Tax=Cerina litoralis TaxID=2874477 RepID=A0AAE3JSW8_9FLAO|nr:hypothetical protein [Cerina litoralis]MCG2462958.1 hypothetical protein [Cerina litoralis]
MKKIVFIVGILCGYWGQSQINPPGGYKPYDRISAEVMLGYHVPLSPGNGIHKFDYAGFKHFDIGGRFMFNQLFGLKGNYVYDRFEDRNNRDMGNTYNRIGVEAVFNFLRVLDVHQYYLEKYAILVHGGLGLTLAYPDSRKVSANRGLNLFKNDRNERLGSIIFGVTPTMRLNDVLALALDMTMNSGTAQQYGYDGETVFPDYRDKTVGTYMTFSVGLQFSIGQYRRHADYY